MRDSFRKVLKKVMTTMKERQIILDPFKSIEIADVVKTLFMRLDTVDYNELFKGYYNLSLRQKIDDTKIIIQGIEAGFSNLFHIEFSPLANQNTFKTEAEISQRAMSQLQKRGVRPFRRSSSANQFVDWNSPLESHEHWLAFWFLYYIVLTLSFVFNRSELKYNYENGKYEIIGISWVRYLASKRILIVLFIALGVLILFKLLIRG